MPKRRKESDHADANTPSLPSIADAASILAGDADDSGAAAVPHSKRKANLISNNNNGNTTPTINSDGGGGGGDSDDPTGKSTNAIPIFLKKTYRMIDTCDPEICSWTADGEMFVVKNPVRYTPLVCTPAFCLDSMIGISHTSRSLFLSLFIITSSTLVIINIILGAVLLRHHPSILRS